MKFVQNVFSFMCSPVNIAKFLRTAFSYGKPPVAAFVSSYYNSML